MIQHAGLALIYRTTLIAFLIVAAPAAVGGEDIEILEEWPTCDFERLGPVSGQDGKKVGIGSGGSKRANVDRATARLIRAAEKLDADRVVMLQRNIQRDGSKVRFVELRGIAIGPCKDD